MVQWLKLRNPNAGGLGSTSGQESRSHVLQLRVSMLQLKILHAATKIPRAATKTWCSQINKYIFFNLFIFIFVYVGSLLLCAGFL